MTYLPKLMELIPHLLEMQPRLLATGLYADSIKMKWLCRSNATQPLTYISSYCGECAVGAGICQPLLSCSLSGEFPLCLERISSVVISADATSCPD